jgi:hypothetical protein
MTDRGQLGAWFDEGIRQRATWMLIKWDSFDAGDYPVYVTSDKDPHAVAKENNDRLMEVYWLDPKHKATQLAADRAFNWTEPSVTVTQFGIMVYFSATDQGAANRVGQIIDDTLARVPALGEHCITTADVYPTE